MLPLSLPGVGTAIVRAFVSVPLHCATGLIIGISLADRRFFHQDTERWCVIVAGAEPTHQSAMGDVTD